MITSKFKWSKEVAIISILVIALMISAVISIWLTDSSPLIARVIITVTLVLVVALTAIWTPRTIMIDENGITCQLLAKKIVIPRSAIVSITPCNARDALRGSMRLFGSGGFLGYIGVFRNSRLGRFSMYITSRESLILVKTETKTYIFNCKTTQEELDQLLAQGE